ncbi:adenylate/guanylate cyclase domain-containing protein [Bradyrhizobium lablabi]|uniref:adenylate/guanylate cyclase domain-containing protein n=1 Tax=Bradyrhizobium lablabi TaxID=722472 RepID=UPI001BA6DA04|nr:adenylate/guanylate cyclase domain-containing protein [Bradyrhizobium lablabi]MBR0693055.1 adenylate/guanylate cyclase domain-containing protein [Bradyrhizobium lablabi]
MMHERPVRVERRLSAILAADVAGYSRLMADDEEATHAKLTALLTDAVYPAITEHGGRIVKNTGDGFLAEFPSAVEAIRAAFQFQSSITELTIAEVEDRRIAFRVGVNIGDVIVEAHDIFGDGVNIAARLEGIAEPGGICISSSAYDQVRGKVAVEFTNLGEQSLKNISRPIRAYAVMRDGFGSGTHFVAHADVATRAVTAGQKSRIIRIMAALVILLMAVSGAAWYWRGAMGTGARQFHPAAHLSIVVLPFANLSGDPEQDYFVDGVTESLTTDLSRIGGSFVIARNSAFSYKGRPIDVRQVGHELNVRYVLEGSVQRGGNRLRVNVQLIDAESGKHLWAERFERPVVDLFDMQDEIASRLANTLGTQLVAAEARRAERSQHPGALDLVFQGFASLYKEPTPEHLTQARGFFERALAIDPQNAGALVGTAIVELTIGASRFTDDRRARLAAAEATATKALSLAPNYAAAHSVLGATYILTNRAAQGIAECERALALDRSLAEAHSDIGLAKYFMGRAAETEGHVLEALRISPRDVSAFRWMFFVGAAKLQLGADAEAAGWLRRSIEANHNYPLAHFWLAATLGLLGAPDEARNAAKAGLGLDPGFTIRRMLTGKSSYDPTFVAGLERAAIGMRLAGVPEG